MVNRESRILAALLVVLQVNKACCQYVPPTVPTTPLPNPPVPQIGQLILPAMIEPTVQTFQPPFPYPSPPCPCPPPPCTYPPPSCYPLPPPPSFPTYQNQPPQVIIIDEGSGDNNMDMLYLLLIASKGGGLFGGNKGGCGGGCGCGSRCGGNCCNGGGYGYSYDGGYGSTMPPICLTITTTSSDASESQ
ncbi:acrosin-like [Galleria mellonella]|uniref:Acrosin-like n=1 Tax=Galleria mellonella TaxID=7137 RepID=A0ABM3MAT7_GALME|nr:acrosin-like [Galleria mellonella]